MHSLINSDFYYHWRNKKVYIYALIILLMYILGMTVGNIEWSSSQALINVYCLMINQQNMMIIIALLCVSCYYQGKYFDNRLIMYQVLSHGRRKTILSKYFIQCSFNIIFFTVISCLALFFLSFVYEYQLTLDFRIVIIYIMLIIIIIRYSVRIVSIVLRVKNGVLGAVVGWMMTVVEMLPLLTGIEYDSYKLIGLSRFFVPGQIHLLTQMNELKRTVPVVIVTSSIEVSIEIISTLKKDKKSDLI